MSGRITQRVVCTHHGTIMAHVRQTPEGPLYEGIGPVIERNDAAFLRAQGFSGPRLPPTRGGVSVLVASPEAEDVDSWEHRGTLPAWCPECDECRWIDLTAVRRGEKTIRSP